MPASTQPDGTTAPRLLDGLRQTLRVRHDSLRIEQQYINWVRCILRFHPHRYPRKLGLQRSARNPDKPTAHAGLIFLARPLGHPTGCGQPWITCCSPDKVTPYPGTLKTAVPYAATGNAWQQQV